MKHLKIRTFLLLLLSFVCINVNAWHLKYKYINDNTEVEVAGIVLEVTKNDFGIIISEERISEVKTVEIPSFYNGLPVTSIGDKVFQGCSNLVSVTLPSNLKKIGEHAFEDCSRLTSVTIPNSVTSIGYLAFSCCRGLTEITIPNSETYIGREAFSFCTGLTSVNFPNSVTDIGEYAFWGCSGLTSITIPTSILEDRTFIGECAFKHCSGLTSVTFGNTVGRIGDCAFYGCPLESISFGSDHGYVGTAAFSGRRENCTVHIQDLSNWLQIFFRDINANPLCGLKNNLFVNGEEISGTLVVENTFFVGDYTLPEQDKITSVVFSSDVEYIGIEAFASCKNLTSITLSNGVRKILKRAFNGTKLRSVTIPASIEYIGKYAFGTSRLDYAVILKDTPPEVEVDYSNIPEDPFFASVLYVPVGSYKKYKNTRPWNKFTIIEGLPSGIESVEEGHVEELGRYLLDGTKVEEPQKGLNIIKYSDDSTKKVMVK